VHNSRTQHSSQKFCRQVIVKPKVRNVSQRHQRRTESRPQVTCTKQLGEVRPCDFRVTQADRQTDIQTNKQADIFIAFLRTPLGWYNAARVWLISVCVSVYDGSEYTVRSDWELRVRGGEEGLLRVYYRHDLNHDVPYINHYVQQPLYTPVKSRSYTAHCTGFIGQPANPATD